MIGDRWGVTDSEILRPYPCDEFVVSPTLQAWRGVWVEAPVAAVWPRVAQVRLAPYSYDWIDNLGRRSPQQLVGLLSPAWTSPSSPSCSVGVNGFERPGPRLRVLATVGSPSSLPSAAPAE
jgi:hypothetical protein